MRIEYQFHDDATVPDVRRLWAEQTDWGETTLRYIDAWLAAAPFGKPHAVVAVDRDSGDVVGQFRFVPSVVFVDDAPVRAVRPFGAIVSPALSRSVLTIDIEAQPAVAMFLHGVREMQARGTQLVHMTPDPHWVGLFRRSPDIQFAHFPLWSRPLPVDRPLVPDTGYTFGPLEAWDARVDRLWAATARRYGCSLVRNAETLRWKLALGGYTVTGVMHEGELVGVAAGVRRGDRQWLVCDLLSADDGESLHATLAAATTVADAEARAAAGGERARELRKVGVLATPAMEATLRVLGFAPDAYRFPMAVQALDPAIARESVAPARWYVAAND